MKTINPADPRFIKITDCKIGGLYKELPYGGYLLQISYKNKAEDLFSQYQDIHIDQGKFLQEIAEYKPRKSKCKELTRLIYTHGMTDIDFYIQEKQLVIFIPFMMVLMFTFILMPKNGKLYRIKLRWA